MWISIIVGLATLLPSQKEPSKDAAKLSAARDQAKVCAEASASSDHAKLVDAMMPELIETMGGREAAIKKIGEALEGMKKDGVDYVSATVSMPDALHPVESDLYVIVPMAVVFKTGGGKFKMKSYLVGHSSDEGKTWKFVDGSPGEAELRKLLPKLPKVMRFPNKEKPQKLPG